MTRAFMVVFVLFFFIGCEPGQLFGPNTARVSIVASSRMPNDALTILVNGEALEPKLTDSLPAYRYRPRIQTSRQSGRTEWGIVHVSAWSARLGRMSRTKSAIAYEDQVIEFEFNSYDFQ